MRFLAACALLIPCVAFAGPQAQPKGDYHVQVTNRHDGQAVVERYVLSSRDGKQAGTTEVALRPVRESRDGALPVLAPATRVLLDAEGQPIDGDRQLAQAVRLSLGAQAQPDRKVELPDGGWFRLISEERPPARKRIRGQTVEVLRVRQTVEGRLGSGEPLTGELRFAIVRSPDGELHGLRGVQRLRVLGEVIETQVQVGREPFASAPDRRIGLAPKFETGPSLAGLPALGCLVLVVLGIGRGVGKQKAICLLLCGAMLFLCVPAAQPAYAGWPFGLDEKVKKVADKVAPIVSAVGFGLAGGAAGALVGGPIGAVIGAVVAAPIGYTVYEHYWAKREVIDKVHEPASRYVSSLGGTSTLVDDEDWILELSDGRKRYVSKEVYDSVEVGDSWRITGGDAFDDPVERESTAEEKRALKEAQANGDSTVTLSGAGSSGASGALEDIGG